ncbi:MAG: membrane protein insertase YidC [Clostridia bacterium]|nr:membrane protein insertase YidC [Clostridia bacterium]
MLLAFQLSDIVTVPFGWLLAQLYHFTNNYGVAMIIFAILVKLILAPASAKSKKSSMKMSRLTPRMKQIQDKYANDPQKQNEMIQALYKEEGVSMGGGCLWSLLPLLVLFPLYTVIRQPIVYMLGESLENAEKIISIIKEQAPNLFTQNTYYDQIIAARYIGDYAEAIKAAIPEISDTALAGMNFGFLGIDLGQQPSFNIFAWEVFNWANIGLFLVPVLSAGIQVLSMWISMRMNNTLVTDKNGVYDEETAKSSQANQTSKTMMWMMPLMSLWIGFTVPAALSLYWFIQGVVSLAVDTYLTKKYRKIYDAEDAVRLAKAMEEDRIEAEKERIRAERRAANPEGITENTSKKKLQQKQQREAEAAKAAAAKEYAAKKGIVEEEDKNKPLSGIADRPYCKGRAYDPNRYAADTTEE